ncbi:MAG: hypothetical protein Q9187_004436 [Circinaria calcarea]
MRFREENTSVLRKCIQVWFVRRNIDNFPFNSYGDDGRSQLPHVHRILKEYDEVVLEASLPTTVCREVCSTLLAASRFSTTAWKRTAIERAKRILATDTDCYLHAWAAHRESALLRMLGEIDNSNQALIMFVHSTVFPGHDKGLEANSSWNAQRGDLVISYAENLAQQNDLIRAKQELLGWKPIDPTDPSTMERLVLRSRNINLGKMLRYEGRFQDALSYLEDLLHESELDGLYEGTGWGRTLLSNVADLLIELDRPGDAEALLMPELTRMASRGCHNVSSGRRLQLALIEGFMKRGMYDRAEENLLKLQRVYEAIADPDTLPKKGIFRVWTSLARISHSRSDWNKAISGWQQALEALDVPEWQKGFNAGLVRYSLAYALFMIGSVQESSEVLKVARMNLESEGRKFWIVGFNSYWHDFIIERITTTGL